MLNIKVIALDDLPTDEIATNIYNDCKTSDLFKWVDSTDGYEDMIIFKGENLNTIKSKYNIPDDSIEDIKSFLETESQMTEFKVDVPTLTGIEWFVDREKYMEQIVEEWEKYEERFFNASNPRNELYKILDGKIINQLQTDVQNLQDYINKIAKEYNENDKGLDFQ